MLFDRYTNPGDLFIVPFAGTYSTDGACMLLPLHRQYIVSNKENKCKKNILHQLVEVFALQILNNESDIKSTDEVNGAASFSLNNIKPIRSRTKVIDRDAPEGLLSIRYFRSHIVHFISTLNGHFGSSRQCNKLLRRHRSYMTGAGIGVFVGRIFGQDGIVGSYFGSLIY